MKQNQDLKRIRDLPVFGSWASGTLDRAVGDITAEVIEEILEDLSSPDNHDFVEDLVSAFLHEREETEMATNEAVIEGVIETLELVKQQVHVKRWRQALDEKRQDEADMNDWNNQSARNIARALRDGVLTSEELTGEMLARIRNRNPALNAVIHLDAEQAMEQARALDEERRQGHIRGLLHGMPMTIKDVWEVAGMPCTAGSSRLREHVPERDADVVQRLRDAGAIIMGKTNVPVFASDLQTYNRLHGVTNNPYDPSRTPGGSSGGARQLPWPRA